MATSIETVLKRHTAELLRLRNVTGVGIGEKNGKEVILVFVQTRASGLHSQIPKSVEGFEIDVRPQIRVDNA